MKTHTFRLGRYRILEAPGVDGFCDVPGNTKILDMMVLEGDSLRALNTSIHEAMHAEGISNKYVHDGSPDRIARFLWRLGWRRICEK